MHDLKSIRDNREAFDAALVKRDRAFAGTAEHVLEIDERRRHHLTALQDAQARRNAASKEIGKAKAAGEEAGAQALIDEVAKLKAFIQQGEEKERELDRELQDFLATIPNLPLDDVPEGADESANVVLREVGKPPEFAFEAKQHFEIGENLGLMDFETAAKLSGARFVVLKGALARLERALGAFMLDLHTDEFGYTEVLPPALVRDEALFGTGQLPKFEDDQFATFGPITADDLDEFLAWIGPGDEYLVTVEGPTETSVGTTETRKALNDAGRVLWKRFIGEKARLWLIPTAEVPLTNLVREEILAEADLPMRVTAWTPCFRAEAGAAGKDTRGMIRQHQFSKVELVSIVRPEESRDELERMTACAEEVLKRLDLPYRVVTLSTGDMGFAAQKTYDIEVWLPGQGTYREISSCSVCGEFQARRMNARYRPQGDKQARFVHTLNGSGLAVGRTMIAILENCQHADGSVTIPEVLRPYMGGLEKISASRA